MRARTFLEFPTRPIRKNRIRVTNCRNASGFCVRALRAPTTWPRFHLDCLVGAYRFGICAVSASFLISYILAANVGWVWGWSCSSYYTIIINNEAAAPVSRIAYRVRIFGCPFAIVGWEKSQTVFFLFPFSFLFFFLFWLFVFYFFFLRLTRRLIPLGIFAPLTWIAFLGNYVYPVHRSFNVL